ncbi:MAG: hypothetical protein JWO36_1599 [Myxococcales bacterium]|nr:hypothetical protein [Myxococcales bacterium]
MGCRIARARAGTNEVEENATDQEAGGNCGSNIAAHLDMATHKLPPANHVMVATLHGALDHVAEVEELIAQMTVPFTALKQARRLGFITSEMRALLTDLLRPETRR